MQPLECLMQLALDLPSFQCHFFSPFIYSRKRETLDPALQIHVRKVVIFHISSMGGMFIEPEELTLNTYDVINFIYKKKKIEIM